MDKKELLKIYNIGFEDELDGFKYLVYLDEIEQRAYNTGRLDAIAGDEVSSIDQQSDEDILNNILI